MKRTWILCVLAFGLVVSACTKSEVEAPGDPQSPSAITADGENMNAEAVQVSFDSQDPNAPVGQFINDDGDDESGPRNPTDKNNLN